jgi:hypothetical protein
MDNHTSVAGIRQMFSKNVFCISAEKCMTIKEISGKKIKRIFQAYPAQSNFDGKIYSRDFDETLIYTFSKFCDDEKLNISKAQVFKLLDIASLVSTSRYDNSIHKPSFAPFSLYKIFGTPTALGMGFLFREIFDFKYFS